MIRLLGFLSWRHFQRHRLRTLLTISGIILGVAVVVAIAIVNRSLIGSFQRTIELVAGKAVNPPEVIEHRKMINQLKYTATPNEIASVVVFLSSSAASFMTGAIIPVSGGTEVGYGVK